jgi:hypothetical protein
VKLTTHLHLVQRSRISVTIPPLPQYNFMAWCLVKAQVQLYLKGINYFGDLGVDGRIILN